MSDNEPLSDYEYLRTQDALNAHVVVSVADVAGIITYVNDNFCQISGYERDELIGQNHRILKSGKHSPEFYQDMWQTISSGDIWTGDVCNCKKNGEFYWVTATITPFLDEQGKPYKYVSYRTDITKIKNQEQTHLDLLNSMGEGVFGLDTDGICTFINQSALTMFGYENDELIGQYLHSKIHYRREDGSSNPEVGCAIFNALSDRQPNRCESWFLDKSDNGFHVSLTIAPRYEHGNFIGVLVSFHDISRRKKAELQHQVSAERFRRSQIAADMGTWDWDLKTNELFWSERIAPLFGYEEGMVETTFENFLKVIHPDDTAAVQAAIQAAIDDDEPYEIEHRVVWPDGSEHWLLEVGAVFHDEDGNAEKMLGTVMNIHHRKIAELELKDSQEHLSIAIEGAGDGVWDWDMTTNAVSFSDLYAKMLGYTVGEMPPELGTWIHSVHPEDWPRVQSTLQHYLEGELSRYEIEFRMRCKDGSWKWVLSRGKVVAHDVEGNPMRMTGVHTDINVRKKMESDLLHAKVAAEAANQAKSEFLSSMSHELRTPLNAVIGFAQILEEDSLSPLTSDQKDSLKHISDSGHHLLALINDVLELAKIETGSVVVLEEHVVFAQLIDECLPILNNLALANNIEIIVNDESDTIFYADYTRVKQVLLNLCSNAIKYNDEGGRVTIDCVKSERNLMRVNITDTGIGIPKDKQEQLFTAFNRLGQENSGIEGTGVGLIITKKLIDQMGGELGFTSVDGLGTTFWFELPVIEKGVNQLPERFSGSTSLSNVEVETNEMSSKKILYVEDNQANIKLMQAFFARDSHLNLQVVLSAEEGLELIEEEKPALILMDINLPGMSGNEAAEKLKSDKVYKDIPIIALSAVAMKHDIEKFEGLFDAYITKPVDFTVLMEEVEKQLSKRHGK